SYYEKSLQTLECYTLSLTTLFRSDAQRWVLLAVDEVGQHEGRSLRCSVEHVDRDGKVEAHQRVRNGHACESVATWGDRKFSVGEDRKSTRLNSSHVKI